jgi:hypothetical protein
MSTYFTSEDCGCWADGTHGSKHVREMLHSVLINLPEEDFEQDQRERDIIAESLLEEMPDDASDEIDALDILQRWTEEGLSWQMEGGDLILCEQEED